MTATKDLPRHGSEARYQGATGRPGCRCRTCITGWTQAGQRRQLARLQGRPATIPAGPVTQHLRILYASDLTTGQIATASGADSSTIKDHARGRFPRIRRTTAVKLLAVQPDVKPTIGFVPALGSMRRCRALYAVGHAPADIAAAHPDLQLRSIEYIVHGARRHVAVFLHDAIGQAYRTLAATPGTSTRAAARAAREGWAGPDYWDDADFDDPTFTPAAAAEANRDELAALRREEIEHLAWCGHSPDVIRDRLNREVSISTVRQIVAEWRTGQKRQRPKAVAA